MNKFFLIILFCKILIAFEAQLFPKEVLQGNSFAISVTTDQTIDESKLFFNKKYHTLYSLSPNRYQTILGIYYNVEPKRYPIHIKLYRESKEVFTKTLYVNVKKQTFKKATLLISDKKVQEGATDWNALRRENSILGSTFRSQLKKRLWQGSFGLPITNFVRISSPYGSQRDYQNEKGAVISHWVHKGIDYSAHLGSFVFATNSGKVTVSDTMKVHGKTLVINHGHGIISTYNHLSQRFVKPGEYVYKGQCIARSGNSGLTTGAHLHYGLSVNNVRVNPEEWFERDFSNAH